MVDKTTEDMLRDHLESVREGLEEALVAQRRVDETGEPDEEMGEYPLDEFPLAANLNMAVRIQVSAGGPNIWIEVPIHNDGQAVGTATLAWGSEVEKRNLVGDSLTAAIRIAENYAETALAEAGR